MSFNADTHITDWLDALGIEHDVITDEILHEEGLPLLSGYRAVMTGSHPEYLSIPMWTAVRDYLDDGGRLMYMEATDSTGALRFGTAIQQCWRYGAPRAGREQGRGTRRILP